MGLLWPMSLLLLGLIPLVIGLVIWIQRRRRRYAVRYSSLVLVRAAIPDTARFRRYFPIALFLLALASLVAALSRPVAYVSVPAGEATIILAMDVSRSMCLTDIQPNRLEAAQSAAKTFIGSQDPNTQIGIVAFAGFAALIQPPTAELEALKKAVESLTTGRRTAIGSAILTSLDAIAELNQDVAPSSRGIQPDPLLEPLPDGEYVPDIIVLLTDGASNSGPLPLDAAQQAADRGVRVYTISFGTTDPEGESIPYCGAQSLGDSYYGGGFGGGFGGGGFGGGGFGGGGGGYFRRGIDEPTLQEIALITGGEYYSAASTNELQKVFEDLPIHLIFKQETHEISVVFAMLGWLLAVLALGLSLLWHPLP